VLGRTPGQRSRLETARKPAEQRIDRNRRWRSRCAVHDIKDQGVPTRWWQYLDRPAYVGPVIAPHVLVVHGKVDELHGKRIVILSSDQVPDVRDALRVLIAGHRPAEHGGQPTTGTEADAVKY
jgi:hypothetical protein